MVGAVNIDPMIQQMTTQGRPLIRAEVLFVRKVCQPGIDQLRTINREATAVLKDVATQIAEARGRPRMRNVAQGKIMPAPMPDANKLLRDGLAAVMKKDLTPRQWADYQAEVEKRSESQKKHGVAYLVDALDRELVLSDQQRAAIAESLAAHWDDSWVISLDYALYGNRFFPIGIDPYVTNQLSDNQKKVWQSVQRVGGFWNFGTQMSAFTNDGDALEEELGEPAGGPSVEANGLVPPLGDVLIQVQARRIEAEKSGESGGRQEVTQMARSGSPLGSRW